MVPQTGCGKSLVFQLVPKVCLYLHDRGFRYPKAAIEVVICSLNALIDSLRLYQLVTLERLPFMFSLRI